MLLRSDLQQRQWAFVVRVLLLILLPFLILNNNSENNNSNNNSNKIYTATFTAVNAFIVIVTTKQKTVGMCTSSSRRSSSNSHNSHQPLLSGNYDQDDNLHENLDLDYMERVVGGSRYDELVPLPDSMTDTTAFVGNLNEFAKDNDLEAFVRQQTKNSTTCVCVVVRKANTESLEYGFCIFSNPIDKMRAIRNCHHDGTASSATPLMMGRPLRMESIRKDDISNPKKRRVRVPERLVHFVLGENAAKQQKQKRLSKQKKKNSRTQKLFQKQDKRQVFQLSHTEQAELLRAAPKGYLTLDGTGYRRGRKSSALACAHRQRCDEQSRRPPSRREMEKEQEQDTEPAVFTGCPQIVLCKASGGRRLDCVIVDLSPLRKQKKVTKKDNGNDKFSPRLLLQVWNYGQIFWKIIVKHYCGRMQQW